MSSDKKNSLEYDTIEKELREFILHYSWEDVYEQIYHHTI